MTRAELYSRFSITTVVVMPDAEYARALVEALAWKAAEEMSPMVAATAVKTPWGAVEVRRRPYPASRCGGEGT